MIAAAVLSSHATTAKPAASSKARVSSGVRRKEIEGSFAHGTG